jgi:tRNA pseudouridine55 synthase
MSLNGILLVDKPEEWTSHDVVAKLRGVLSEKRIGHSGTLDPIATGLLLVFVGRATRAAEFADGFDKEYIAGLRTGIKTDTQDIGGKTIYEKDCSVMREELETALAGFRGYIKQVPPMYSAIKVGGTRLYKLARQGMDIERKARDVNISRLEIVDKCGSDWVLRVGCSKGTYIRTLCSDIGDALGCGAVMTNLRRTAINGFSVNDAYSLLEIEAAAEKNEAGRLLLPVDRMFMDRPAVSIDAPQEFKCRNGSPFELEAPDGYYRVYSEDGSFLMLGAAKDGMMTTVKSFFEV